jgi:hypothetical protein
LACSLCVCLCVCVCVCVCVRKLCFLFHTRVNNAWRVCVLARWRIVLWRRRQKCH